MPRWNNPNCGFQKGHPKYILHLSEEHKRKIGEANKGNPPWTKGKHLPEITKQRISIAHIGKKLSKEHREKLSKSHISKQMGKNNPRWKGGQFMDKDGYILVLQSFHPRMNKNGYVKRSYLIMEKIIGRFLESAEIVHHINGIRNDDKPKNLKLFKNQSEHKKYHFSHL